MEWIDGSLVTMKNDKTNSQLFTTTVTKNEKQATYPTTTIAERPSTEATTARGQKDRERETKRHRGTRSSNHHQKKMSNNTNNNKTNGRKTPPITGQGVPTTTSSSNSASNSTSSSLEVLQYGANERRAIMLEKLGGKKVLNEAIDKFYDRQMNDPELAKFFKHTDMQILKWHQMNFMSVSLFSE